MTDPVPPPAAHAGAPFAEMLRGALVPSSVAGAVAVVAVAWWRGGDALAGAVLGLAVAIAFFASGMFLLSRLVRDASPHAFFAVAMTVYLGQVIGLLLVIIAFKDASWVDGMALGVVVLVVTLVWQVFAFRSLRHSRMPVYDQPPATPRGQS